MLGSLPFFVVATNTSDGKDVQTYIRLVYLYHSYIRIYKKNLTEFLLLSELKTIDLVYFIFLFIFLFSFIFYFLFLTKSEER